MKRSILILLLITLLTLSACLIPFSDLNYVEGEVGIGIREDIDLEELSRYIYTFDDLAIKSITTFLYYSTLPPDSISFIRNSLNFKPYNRTSATRIFFNEDSARIEIDLWVGEFTAHDTNDWKETKRMLELHHVDNYFQVGLISVPKGKELDWIEILNENPIFRFAELNYINRGCDS